MRTKKAMICRVCKKKTTDWLKKPSPYVMARSLKSDHTRPFGKLICRKCLIKGYKKETIEEQNEFFFGHSYNRQLNTEQKLYVKLNPANFRLTIRHTPY